MTKRYLVLVDGRLAERKLTFSGALRLKKELESKGYLKVSVAEELVTV